MKEFHELGSIRLAHGILTWLLAALMMTGVCPVPAFAIDDGDVAQPTEMAEPVVETAEGFAEETSEEPEAADPDSALLDEDAVAPDDVLSDPVPQSEPAEETPADDIDELAEAQANADDIVLAEQATSVIASGYCGTTEDGLSGKNVRWTLTSDGLLALEGTGATDFYSYREFFFGSPVWPGWHDHADQITSVSIGEGITKLGSATLANLPNITEVTLPSTMRELGQVVFYNDSSLTSVKLNDGLEYIGTDVYEGTQVTTLEVPASVRDIDRQTLDAFTLDNITFLGPDPHFAIVDGILYSADMTTLKFCPQTFEGSYVIPSTVKSIAERAFEGVEGLTSVTFPDGLESIGAGAFCRTHLTSIDIPDSVTYVGTCAFHSINRFNDVPLEHVRVSSHVVIEDPYDNAGMFGYCSTLQSIEIPEGVERLGESALEECLQLSELYLPDSFTIVDKELCMGCSALESVRLSPYTKSIGMTAFAHCGSLEHVDIPYGVESIGEGAFYGSALKEVTIPASVTSIGKNAFPKDCVVTVEGTIYHNPDGSYAGPEQVTPMKVTLSYGQGEARKMLAMVNGLRTGSEAWWYADDSKKTKERPDSALGELSYDYTLEQYAMERAAEIALVFDHHRLDGGLSINTFPTGYYSCGENIACGVSTAKAAMELWKETNYGYSGQGHRRNMLGSEFNCIGIGHAVVDGIHYWVQELGYATDPDTTATKADNGTHTRQFVIENEYFDEMDSVQVKPSPVALGNPGSSASLPIVQAANVRIRLWGNVDTWMPFDASATVIWTSDNPSIAKVKGNKVVAVAETGSTFLRTTAFGRKLKVRVVVGVKGNLKDAKVSDIANQGYTGRNLTPKLKVSCGGVRLAEGVDYTIKYANNKKIGTARATITGVGSYIGAKKVSFKIVAGKQTISAANKAVRLGKSTKLWAKTSGNGKLTYKVVKGSSVASVSENGVVKGKKVGTAVIKITAAKTKNYKAATKTVKVKVGKANSLDAKATKTKVTVVAAKLEAADVTLASNVKIAKRGQGAMTYANASSGVAKKFIVDAKTGKLTVPAQMPIGTYNVKVKVSAKGSSTYLAGSKTVSFQVVVR